MSLQPSGKRLLAVAFDLNRTIGYAGIRAVYCGWGLCDNGSHVTLRTSNVPVHLYLQNLDELYLVLVRCCRKLRRKLWIAVSREHRDGDFSVTCASTCQLEPNMRWVALETMFVRSGCGTPGFPRRPGLAWRGAARSSCPALDV